MLLIHLAISRSSEVSRKLFSTLYNTYKFFAQYANVDGFTGDEAQVPVEERPEIDRWVLSLLNSLVAEVEKDLDDYDQKHNYSDHPPHSRYRVAVTLNIRVVCHIFQRTTLARIFMPSISSSLTGAGTSEASSIESASTCDAI